jgi:hypothetical protein
VRQHPGPLIGDARVFIWFVAASVAIVWTVFRSPAVDYRVVALGSVLGLVEVPFGVGPFQTLAFSVLALVVVMLATVGHRMRRRRWLGIPIGMFLHLVLDGSWTNQNVFWWPFTGLRFAGVEAPLVGRGVWSLVLELIGVMIAVWLWSEFGLDDQGRRRLLVRTGQLDRTFVKHRVPAGEGGA